MATIDSEVHSGTPGDWPYPKPLGQMLVVPTGATTAQKVADVAAHGIRVTATMSTTKVTAWTINDQDIACAGAAVGAECCVSMPATIDAGIHLSAHVSSAGHVSLHILNYTGADITPAGAQTVSVRVFNPPA